MCFCEVTGRFFECNQRKRKSEVTGVPDGKQQCKCKRIPVPKALTNPWQRLTLQMESTQAKLLV